MSAPVYDLEITIRRRTARPFHIARVEAPHAREIVDSFLAAWGMPTPAALEDPTGFAALLAVSGEYQCATDQYRIVVKGEAVNGAGS